MSDTADRYARILDLMRLLVAAQRKSESASEARRTHDVGSSRAKVTTLNARWMAAAEHRDRIVEMLRAEGVDINARPIARSEEG